MIKRRDFIRQSALGTGAMLTSHLFNNKKDSAMGIALVGLGNYSTNQLGPALQYTQNCELKGVVTGDFQKGKAWSEKYGFPVKNIYNYENFDDLEHNDEIEIIYIVLPNFMHHEFTIRALRAGKHVICEKPMAITAIDAQEMVDEAEKQARYLQVGYRLYFEPHHLAVQQRIRENGLENLRLMEASLGFDMARPGLWRIDKDKGGGGAIIDLGLYAIQAARRSKNALPVKVRSHGQTIRKDLFKGIYENMYWQLEFPDGTVCNSSTSYSTYIDRFYASQKSLWCELNPSFNATGAKAMTNDGPLEVDGVLPYQQIAQMDEFVMAIRQGRPSIARGQEGVIDVKIVQAIIKSAQEEKEIYLDWN
ncbi:MAG: Gfo/Idh/MocA family oxidoreductase [Saprospiraceae bacterium]|nr:Gfo/Idh/MocA family oxidoreductase [Saprospiraceae bacterium]